MSNAKIPWAFFALLLTIATVAGTVGGYRFLWVFPLDTEGLPLWMLVCAADVFLALTGFAFAPVARLLLWCGGLLFFTARQNVPFVGIALILTSALLWIAMKRGGRELLPLMAALLVPFFLLGHDSALLHPGLLYRLENLRFSFHLVSAFLVFRMISWGISVRQRGVQPSFLSTMEYFLAPAFWLSPMHGAHLLFDHMERPKESIAKERSFLWLVQGLLHALLFSVMVTMLMPRVEERFRAGFHSVHWWEWVLFGPVLFIASYLEKSRVSYLVAGILSLTGKDIVPDFRSPWAARNLLDYWRRFHFWVWEYYVDLIYNPLSVVLSRRMNASTASFLALFLSFSLGSTLIHWVHYPAPVTTAFLLGVLFGAFSLLHGIFEAPLKDRRIGIPVTWVSVFFLYTLAYPTYGLGWGLSEWLAFLER